MPQFIVQWWRSAWKPECISAAAQRANARAAASAGHTPACRSPTYSVMPSESQTVVAPSTRQGTLPVGENALKASPPKGTSRSWKGIPSSRMSTHGRSDHDE
jgi:hypothetical protein